MTKKHMKARKLLLGVLALSIFSLTACNSVEQEIESSEVEINLYPVDSISHVHGLAVDPFESNKVYLATHKGLFVLIDDVELFRIGDETDDYMGFLAHPTEQGVFYTSGHPTNGGNLGIQKSEDGGLSWKTLSNGVNGPVDFHSMTISSVDTQVLYGWHSGSLQRSLDGGENWTQLKTSLSNVISLVASTEDAKRVYATTVAGILVSEDQGETWTILSNELNGFAVTHLAISSERMLAFTENGLMKSLDKGSTWETLDENFSEDVVIYLAFDPNNIKNAYAFTKNNFLYKSSTGGEDWQKIL